MQTGLLYAMLFPRLYHDLPEDYSVEINASACECKSKDKKMYSVFSSYCNKDKVVDFS